MLLQNGLDKVHLIILIRYKLIADYTRYPFSLYPYPQHLLYLAVALAVTIKIHTIPKAYFLQQNNKRDTK